MGALSRRYGRALKSPSGEPIVLLFSTIANPENAARLHIASCPVVKRFKRTTKRIADYVQETVDDLNERGFPVKFCKCIK